MIPNTIIRRRDKLREIFRQFFSHIDRNQIEALKYFAVRGFPKSGTNWLSNVMNLHPEVFCSGEFAFAGMARERTKILEELPWTVCNDRHMKGRLEKSFDSMITSLMIENARVKSRNSDKRWLGDKTPAPAYPPVVSRSRCIYVIRDVRDVIVSRAYHLLRVKGVWGLKEYPGMMKKLSSHGYALEYFQEHPGELLDDLDWVGDNAKAWSKHVLNATDQMIREKYPDYRIMIIRYEDMHQNIDAIRNECYQFLGLNPEEAKPLDSGKFKTTPGFDRERPGEFYRKGQVGDWKNYFSDDAHELVCQLAGNEMKQFGYYIEKA